MLNNLRLKNFKSIRDLDLSFGALTLLAGVNGSGKSSILQAIGLMMQSVTVEFDLAYELKKLYLNGQWVQIGRGEDLLFEDSLNDERVAIYLEFDEYIEWAWSGMVRGQEDIVPNLESNLIALMPEGLKGFQFIQADRLVPALQYQQAGSEERDQGSLGKRGEWTVDFLARNGYKDVAENRLYPVNFLRNDISEKFLNEIAPTKKLIDACTAWLQNISPGVRPVVQLFDQMEASSLRFRYEGKTTSLANSVSRDYRAGNVGFGLTYCLPIVVACLAAPSGALILLENPEAHLHPRGQFQMGLLLAMCANDGVQIVVETHSDHLLNGIRVATKKKMISADDIRVHFFARSKEAGVSKSVSPRLMVNGRFDDWPEGFFDEWDIALDQLLEDE